MGQTMWNSSPCALVLYNRLLGRILWGYTQRSLKRSAECKPEHCENSVQLLAFTANTAAVPALTYSYNSVQVDCCGYLIII